ncbi:MAG: protease modulator HflC [Thermoanaerobaculia bacterium]
MKGFGCIALVLVAIVGLWSSGYVVNEAEQVILTQFGRPVGDPVSAPGFHFKVPFIQEVHRFEKRFLEWDGEANQLPTRDKRFIWVDMYARWRISDPLKYFQRLKDERGAQTRLDDILDGETRNAIANHDLVEVVRATNRTPELDESQTAEELVTLKPIEVGREKIQAEILSKAQARTEDLGIEILDARLKRIIYVAEVQAKVFDRMIAERERIAARFRSEGEGEALRIQGEKERELKQIGSEAYRTAEEIRGRADAHATEIYAAAYNSSSDSRDFYEFLKTMETFESTIDGDTTLVLSTDGDFYGYLKRSSG